ncbi:hypothetical protein VLK31_07120 [Variovorax sp. H27-G14]|uniref:hypothetical protein n=1 Tax=Variovorax sp. H27-G14 TaxID=3111914 RepID=UPI0038FBEEE7
MDPEQIEQAAQDEAAFDAGFASVAGQDEPTATPAQARPAAEAAGGEKPAGEGVQPGTTTNAAAPAADDQPRIAGLTEAEVRTLLGRVPELEQSLRKVNGKLGEYGSVIQEMRRAPAQPALTPERIQEIEAANPDLAAYVNARMPTSQDPASGEAPQHQPLPSQQPDLQAELMDHFNEGWREKIGSQDFQLWLAAQPDDVRTTFNSTEKAKELSAVISKFDAWGTAKQTQQAKSSARLQNSLTPTGTPGKAKTALSDNDAFEAGFKSVRGH